MQRDERGTFKKMKEYQLPFLRFGQLLKQLWLQLYFIHGIMLFKKRRSLDRVMNYVFLITPIPTPGMDNRTLTSKNKIEEMMGSKTEF